MNNKLQYDPQKFTIGDCDDRPWGSWEVTDVREENGEEVVEKKITVHPTGILSLQSHKYRREIWTVLEGAIRVVLDDKVLDLQKGDTVAIPLGTKHRMSNPFLETAIVHEIQMGQCMESDIIRYEDKYGRA